MTTTRTCTRTDLHLCTESAELDRTVERNATVMIEACCTRRDPHRH